jgi:predicted RNA-binding Zn-ribbon protein involved in translation (DUF1610 family)
MLDRFVQFDICCDAPPYGVVHACEKCGFHSPLDVRWCRMSRFLSAEGQRRGNVGVRLWQWFFGKPKPKARTCTCGQPLPGLKKYGFTFLSQKVGDYFLGQCQRCRTMFWDDALPLPSWMEEDMGGLMDSVEM